MNKEFSEALVTLQNSKESEIPTFAGETLDQAKAELKRLN
jgi:beta-lactam-binding protein with PASTA domain